MHVHTCTPVQAHASVLLWQSEGLKDGSGQVTKDIGEDKGHFCLLSQTSNLMRVCVFCGWLMQQGVFWHF